MGHAAKAKAARKALKQTEGYQKALKIHVRKSCAAMESGFIHDNIYLILATLVTGFGFGKGRLERYLDEFERNEKYLMQFYEMAKPDDVVPQMKEIVEKTGFSLEAWEAKHGKTVGCRPDDDGSPGGGT